MIKEVISTSNAPEAIGTYSQAIRVGNTVYLSGQIPLCVHKTELISQDIRSQIVQVFDNLGAVSKAAGGSLQQVVKINIYLLNLEYFTIVNEVMAQYFQAPYPARATLGVASLPKGAQVEMDAVMVL